MQERSAYYISAATALLLAVATWLIYYYLQHLPVIDYLVKPHFRPFLLSFGPMAAYGVLLAAVASERLDSPVVRLPAGLITVVVAAYFLWLALQAMGSIAAGQGTTFAMVLLPGVSIALAAFILLRGVDGVMWRKIWLFLVALAVVVLPPLVFSVRFSSIQYTLADKYMTLALAIIPALLCLLALLILMTNRLAILLAAVAFGLVAVSQLLAVARAVRSMGPELAFTAGVAVAALALCWLNYRLYKTAPPIED